MNLIDNLKEILTPVINALDTELYDINFVKENNMSILRVMITKPNNGVDLDTCVSVSEAVSAKLDEDDLIKDEYYLEVCSAGAERELRSVEEISSAVGEYVYLKLKKGYDKFNDVKGDLLSFSNNELEISYMDKATKRRVKIKYEDISKIRLSVRI